MDSERQTQKKMRRKLERFLILAACLCVVFLSGCGAGSFDPVVNTGAIHLNNMSNAAVDRFYLVPVADASLGADLVIDLLDPGAAMLLPNINADSYDAKIGVNGRYSDYFAYAYDISVAAGATVDLNIYDSSFTGSLEICNTRAAGNITGVYLAFADESDWGESQTSSTIGPAAVLHLYDLDPGPYKVKVVWEDLSQSIYDGAAGITIDSLTLTTLNVN